MNQLYYVVLLFFIISLAAGVMRWKASKADQDPDNIAKDREAEKKYAELCEADEQISVVCRGLKEEYYVLTNRRLIIDNKKGFHSIPLDTIKNVKFQKMDGGKARSSPQCQIMSVYADRKYTLARYSEVFDQISSFFFERQ